MSIEAMKQALEPMRDAAFDEEGYTINADLAEAYDTLRQAIEQAEKLEPVAWRFPSPFGGWAYGKEPPIGSKYAVQPLYTTPQPQEEHHAKDCALLQIPSKDCDCSQNQELVAWGVDWGKAGEVPCVSIIKRLPEGGIEVLAVEYGPQRPWVGLTPADFDWLEQVFANKVSNDFVFADIVCVISAKLKGKNT